MKKDISNQTIMVLAILAIIISIISVATIYHETRTTTQEQESKTTGTIRLDIAGEPKETSTAGQITLQINNETTE